MEEQKKKAKITPVVEAALRSKLEQEKPITERQFTNEQMVEIHTR